MKVNQVPLGLKKTQGNKKLSLNYTDSSITAVRLRK